MRAWSAIGAGRYLPSGWRKRLRIATADHGVGRLAVLMLGVALPFVLLPFVVAVGYMGFVRYFPHTIAGAAAPAVDDQVASAQTRAAHQVASIVFVPWTGIDKCEKRQFDNANGRITFDGTIECEFEPATENNSQQLRLSGEKPVSGLERMRAIHNSFKQR